MIYKDNDLEIIYSKTYNSTDVTLYDLNCTVMTNHNVLYMRCEVPDSTNVLIGQLPRVSGEDPERIRVDSVFETSVCSLFVLCLFVSKFSQFLYYKVL